jgi:hypothetical protein
MAAQVTKKEKQHRSPTDRVQLVRKRFMEIDVDPGGSIKLKTPKLKVPLS